VRWSSDCRTSAGARVQDRALAACVVVDSITDVVFDADMAAVKGGDARPVRRRLPLGGVRYVERPLCGVDDGMVDVRMGRCRLPPAGGRLPPAAGRVVDDERRERLRQCQVRVDGKVALFGARAGARCRPGPRRRGRRQPHWHAPAH
jgi:hypothetical protein